VAGLRHDLGILCEAIAALLRASVAYSHRTLEAFPALRIGTHVDALWIAVAVAIGVSVLGVIVAKRQRPQKKTPTLFLCDGFSCGQLLGANVMLTTAAQLLKPPHRERGRDETRGCVSKDAPSVGAR